MTTAETPERSGWFALVTCATVLGAVAGLFAAHAPPPHFSIAQVADVRPGLPGDHVRHRTERGIAHRDVTVLIALDAELRHQPGIHADIERWLELGTGRLALAVPISLSIHGFTEFDPPATYRSTMDSALEALRHDCRAPEADIVLGFTANQYEDPDSDHVYHGQAEALGRYAVIQPAHDDADTGCTVAHEVAHLFGAWHENPSRSWIDTPFGPSAGSVLEATLHRDFRRGPAGIPLRKRRWLEELHRRRPTCECGHPSPLVEAWVRYARQQRWSDTTNGRRAARAHLRAAVLLLRDPRTRAHAAGSLAEAANLHWGHGRHGRASTLFARAALVTDTDVLRDRYTRLATRLARWGLPPPASN